MTTALDYNETAILGRAIAAENGGLHPEAARSILAIELSPVDRQEAVRLLQLAKEGGLSSEDDAQLERYRSVGRLLELMKSKARISLKHSVEGSSDSTA